MEDDAVVVDYEAEYEEEQIEEDQSEEVEEFRRIGGYDNYSVSNLGNVRNDRTNRILRPGLSSVGYLTVVLYQNGTKSTKYVHLVASVFIGEANGRDIDHCDRNRLNNHVSNLRYVSKSDNCRNKTSHMGTIYQFVPTLPENAIELTEYGAHHFDNLYYHDGTFYVFTGLEYRILPYITNPRTHSIYVGAYDRNGTHRNINIAKYRRSINDLP
jgi:hypothetical protein